MCGQPKTRAVVLRQKVPGTLIILEPLTALYLSQNKRTFILFPFPRLQKPKEWRPGSLCQGASVFLSAK